MLKFDEKTGYLTLPGLRDAVRVREDGRIEGASGWWGREGNEGATH